MKSPLDNLNLRPFEKRLVVVVGIMMFIVINIWFVVPHFSDWGRVQWRMDKARRTLQAFESEVRQIPIYQAKVRELGSENASVPIEQQALHFNNTREAVAAQASISIGNASKISTRTNQFFLELTQTITLLCKEQQLVDFLYNLGSGNSLIRVRDLSLRPDAPRFQLNANVKLAASYQKRPPPAATAAPAPASAGTPKSIPTPVPKRETPAPTPTKSTAVPPLKTAQSAPATLAPTSK